MNQLRLDTRPLYMLVIDRIKDQSANGEWPPGTRLPSEFELAKLFGVSRATLREALRVLEEEGVVVRRHGIGTFIAERSVVQAGIEQLFSVTEWIERANRIPGTIGLTATEGEASPEDLERFGLNTPEPFWFITRIRTADGDPVVYCEDRIPQSVLPSGLNEFSGSIFTDLERVGRTIAYAETAIKPIAGHEIVFPALGVREGDALLLLEQMHFDSNGCPVLLSANYFRTDTFHFHVLRRRP
ncbi:GntR family transcriptional regulator [Tumebacillus sp. DT12]|uniref:GntR family transcriptional regulator n=1 Tax=Tumebacillus lacus TaxID=2995335 RepID=A0ABT3WXV1_9BACL|nr:GntR family transcriptional regulator [Tumebacillus lacus]MCX7568587.1 GntR family transcriptional regulator [Tumebacillus lacus]